jgi:hypothetical protein
MTRTLTRGAGEISLAYTQRGMGVALAGRDWGCVMVLVVLAFVVVVWGVTVVDVARRRELAVGRRVVWILLALFLPLLAVPVYWLIRPLRPKRSAKPVAPVAHVQTLADLIPGWTPDLPGACEQANAWAADASHVSPEPSFYAWLRESGLAAKYPACSARLLRTLLGEERRPPFAACPELGALARSLELYVSDSDDLRAIKTHLLRLCPEAPSSDSESAALLQRAALV